MVGRKWRGKIDNSENPGDAADPYACTAHSKKAGDYICRLSFFFDSDQDFFFLVVTLVAIPGAI
jgi:hypothetical protein